MHFVKHRKISPGVTPPSDCCQRSASWESMIYHQAYQLHPCHHVAQGIPIWYMLKPQLGDVTCNFPPPQRNNTRGCDFGISIAILNHTTAFLSVFMTENPVAVTVSLFPWDIHGGRKRFLLKGPTKGMCTTQGHNTFIIKAHSIEDVPE